jgi:signal transduction histidine kinase
VKALLTPRGLLTAGSAYALIYMGLTGVLPPPSDPQARLLLADLLLMLPTLVALFSTAAAARRSLGGERAFWGLLAGAAAAQTINEAAYGLHVLAPQVDWLRALAYGAYHGFFALVGASLLVWPHRQLSPERVRGATLDWLMGAAALGYFIGAFVALPNGNPASRWMWVYTIEIALVAAGYLALAVTTREQPFRTVYAILAAGFGASAVVEVVPHILKPTGASDLYSPAHVDWVLTLFAMAAAARAPRAASWMRAAEDVEPERLRPWLAAAAVPLPLVMELALRAAGVQPHLAAERTQVALAFGALLAALAILRAYGAGGGRPPLTGSLRRTHDAAGDSSQYLQFASGVAHELNNPLTVVAGWAELGLKRAAPRLPLEQLLEASRRAAGVVARLQRLSHAAGGPTADGDVSTSESGPQADTDQLHASPHFDRTALLRFGIAAGALLAVQHAVRAVGGGAWWGDATLAVPAAAAGVLLLRRAGDTRTPRRRRFWQLLAVGALAWSAAELSWAILSFRGVSPGMSPAVQLLLLGFLVPMLGAMALRPHRPAGRIDLVAAADVAIVALAVSFVFLRVVFLPLHGASDRSWSQGTLLGILAWVLALWAGALWRTIPQSGWRRVYGLLCLFAVAYGVLSAIANGYGRGIAAPGRLSDMAWMAPFLFLGVAAVRRPRSAGDSARRGPGWAVVVGLGVYATEVAARAAWPAPSTGDADLLFLGASCLCGLALAARLWAGEAAAQRLEAEARRHDEEVRRAGRLGALAALAAATVAELGQVLEEVARLAVHAAQALPGQGRHVVAQAERAREIVRELAESFRLSPVGPRHPLDLGALVEHTVQSALDQGLGLHVRVEGLAGLPRVWGDPAALSAAVHHMLRNAAQASPGGVLRISGGVDERGVVVRLADDGGGVAPGIRSRIFDPFFTTRRVGEGLGLGLTLVHFVARSHGGAVFLDETRSGASFVMRLPAYETRSLDVRITWPWAAAAVVSAALATGLAVTPPGPARTRVSIAMQLAVPLLAAGGLAWVAVRRRGASRGFWALLAAGPALWTVSRLLRIGHGGWDWHLMPGLWPMLLFALGDLAWPAALLLRPDRPSRAKGRFDFGAGAVLCVCAYAHLNLLVLPDPFALADPALRVQLGILRVVLRTSVVIWAAVLAWQAWSPAWRRRYGRLAMVFGLYAAGSSIALQARSQPGYQAGALADLGWILPLLCLAAMAWQEAAVEEEAGDVSDLAVTPPAASGNAAWLVALAAIVAMDTLLGPTSGYPGLDAARSALTRIMVISMALILAAREAASADGRSSWRRWPREVTSSRLLKVVAAALHELGGHVSGMAAVGRLVFHQSEGLPRSQADAQRILDRGDAAGRIIRNLLEALPRLSIGERVRLDRLLQDVVDTRRESLEVVLGPCPDVPEVFAHRAALLHALTALVDRAAGPHGGRMELSTSISGEHPLVTLVVVGAVPQHEQDPGLDMVKEILAREGAEMSVRSRSTGIAEYVIRFDRAPGQESDRPSAWPGASAAG